MKIYAVGPLDDGYEFFPTKKQAIARAKEYDEAGGFVIEYEIGRLSKEVACRLASGEGFAKAQRYVWRNREE